MTKLSERTVLSTLSIGVWSGRAADKQVTEEVSESHQADLKDAGRYSKQLISKKFMSKVGSVASVSRKAHRILTLPWQDDGTRILSTMGYKHYTQQMKIQRQSFNAAVDEFMKHLPEYITEAKPRLGTMFNPDDYPSTEDVKSKFTFDVEIRPVPEASDFRAELGDATVKAIVKDIEARGDARVKAALNDVFERILDSVGKMSERLRAYKPAAGSEPAENSFRDSLIYNVQELADLLPSLNITGDKRVIELQQLLTTQLTSNSPDILRVDEHARKQTADQAEKLLKKVRSYLG